jgi:hypothetical protein
MLYRGPVLNWGRGTGTHHLLARRCYRNVVRAILYMWYRVTSLTTYTTYVPLLCVVVRDSSYYPQSTTTYV